MAKKATFKTREKNKKGFSKKNEKKFNPFEVHINQVKHDVIGRKSKQDRGLPGVSRAKAFKKRERTLLQEYKHGHKSNVFIDRRIGEKDSTMDPDKKIALRIAAEKKKQFSKKSLFNLNDDEELTHGGLPLDEANLKDKLNISDDDDDDDMLDAKFVKEQHFGGGSGFLTKLEDSGEVGHDEKHKSRKEWIDEIIAESKKKKAESKREKEEQYEAVTKLNSELQNFMKMMANQTLNDEDKDKAKRNCEFQDYDSLVRELGFDRTGKARAVEKLKTPEELVKEERDRLHALETERVRRMLGEDSKPQAPSQSADDLNDGFILNEEDKFHVSYKDGRMLANVEQDDEMHGDSGKEDNDEDDNDDEDEKDDDDEESDKDGDESDDSDKYSDILEETDSEAEDASKVIKPKEKKEMDQKKELMEAAKKEIPYTFEVPQDYEAFWSLLENRSPKEVSLIMERMITCNHTSLGGTNKEKCEDIFTYILQTLHVLTDPDGDSPISGVSGVVYVDSLVSHLYTLTQQSPSNSAKALLQVLEEKYEDFSKMKFKRYPSANTFVFLKISGMLFPSSDFIHPVMTPVMTFLTQLLGQAKITTKRDIIAAIFTVHLLLEYINAAKRFIPEMMNVLNGLLFSAIEDENKLHLPLNPPFKHVGPSAHLLVLKNKVTEFTESKLTFASINNDDSSISDDFKVNIIYKVLKTIIRLCKCWTELKSIRSIMEPTIHLLNSFKSENYPVCIKNSLEELTSAVKSLPSQGPPLVKNEKKPVSLKMYEPAIEKVIEGVRKRHGTKEYLEKQKLLHKLKRERKGARREIQRDTSFLARQQLADALQSDAERKRKMRQLLSGLQVQEGEFKKLKKK